MSDLLQRFVDSFVKAVTVEMDAMRQRMGSFEMVLADGVALEGEDDLHRYGFRIPAPDDKLVVHSECTLVTGSSETLVTIASLQGDQIVLTCGREIDLSEPSPTIVIYPWFLYEKLRTSLRSLVESETYFTDTALALFGQGPAVSFEAPDDVLDEVHELNDSQRQAVRLCTTTTPAFVWGPPGTGKTTTLGHIVVALLRLDQRILITSTTNAAVDQALHKIMGLDAAKVALDEGKIVRIGSAGEQSEASLHNVVDRLNRRTRDELDRLQQRRQQAQTQRDGCAELLSLVDGSVEPEQLGLFGATAAPSSVNSWQLAVVFGDHRTQSIASMSSAQLQRIVALRLKRLDIVLGLLSSRIAARNRDLRNEEVRVIREARVVLATMANVYVNRQLTSERFDTVIAEEAGMAVLPTLFYCASLARQRAIMVGDPQQLPPIVQSRQDYVHRAMGRGIFAVTVPKPHNSDLVVMLDTQYRMHPDIGDLVGGLFYDGRLRHGEHILETQRIAERAPSPGASLIVMDTAGATTCATLEGSYSRFNETTAGRCVELAIEAMNDGMESVAIITPYAEQSRVIRQLLPRDTAETIECRTVHRFQGGERDMVIFDTVDTDPMRPGVLLAGAGPGASASNLINVSISRARGKLVIIADVAYFRRHRQATWLNQMLEQAIKAGRLESLT